MHIRIIGKLVEVGMFDSGQGRGIRIEKDGEIIEISGLTEEEADELEFHLGKTISIGIAD